MRRFVLGAAVTATLVMPLGATAGEMRLTSEARGTPALRVSFTLRIVNGTPTKVKKFVFRDLLLSCDQADVLLTNAGNAFPAMGVDGKEFKGKFSADNSAGTETYDIAGKIRNKGKRAEGTLRARGTFVDSTGVALTNCDSGKQPWAVEEN